MFVQSAITEVVAEQISGANGNLHDHKDDGVEAAATAKKYQTCLACKSTCAEKKVNLHKSLLCCEPEGGTWADRTRTAINKFIQDPVNAGLWERAIKRERPIAEGEVWHVPHNHQPDQPDVIVSDPAFVNPNSYDSLTAVLRKIGHDAGISRYGGHKQSWLIVCCDGLPYHLCMKLIQQTFICVNCSQSIFGSDKMDNHLKQKCVNSSAYREFEWVLLKIGGGHYEMNMSDVASTLSFKSPLAQLSAKHCDDTHKTWALLLTFHLATIQELVLEYVCECLVEGSSPTSIGFNEYTRGKRTPTTKFENTAWPYSTLE